MMMLSREAAPPVPAIIPQSSFSVRHRRSSFINHRS
jgi:hypothetical protein